MLNNSRVGLVRQALRDGLPLHQVEAYFDWLDIAEIGRQSPVEAPPRPSRAAPQASHADLVGLVARHS